MPIWKKGLVTAASVAFLWLTGSAALGWFFDPVRTGRPRATVSGTAVLAKTGEPLRGAWIGFHLKDGGDGGGGYVTKDGKFSAGVFPGSYVVTVGPDPEGGLTAANSAVLDIPTSYKNPKTSPLTAEVSRQENSLALKIK